MRKYYQKKLSSGFTFLFRSLNSKKFRQNLASMVMNNENMGLSQQVLVLLEATIHLWREHEFQGKGPSIKDVGIFWPFLIPPSLMSEFLP